MKKNRLKIVAVVLSLVMAFGLTGCFGMGKNENTDKKALLVVSFGSSYIENRELAIDATEEVIKDAFPDYDFFNAYTSQTIIDIYQDRDGIDINNVEEAMAEIYKGGYGEVLVVPTQIINGDENQDMEEEVKDWEDKFDTITISTALLTSYEDYLAVVDAIKQEVPEATDDNAVVLMGHGTSNSADSAYGALDYIFKDEGNPNIYVGTVEGFPTFETVLKYLKEKDYTSVTLVPAMLVAGDHAHNDMAGDEEDSWKNMLKAEGYDVNVVMHGLGELSSIQNLFVEHANQALEEE